MQPGGADAAPDRVDEHPFARAHVPRRHERVVRGDEGLGDAAHRDEIEAVGNAGALGGGHATYSAWAPPPAMPNTAAPGSTRPHVRRRRFDDAREFEPGDVGREPGGAG